MLLRWFYEPLRNSVSYFPHPSSFYKYSRRPSRVGPEPFISPVHGQERSRHCGSSSMPEKIPLHVPQCNSSVLLLVVGGEPLAKQGMNHLKMNIKLVWKWNQKELSQHRLSSPWETAAEMLWSQPSTFGVCSILPQPGCRAPTVGWGLQWPSLPGLSCSKWQQWAGTKCSAFHSTSQALCPHLSHRGNEFLFPLAVTVSDCSRARVHPHPDTVGKGKVPHAPGCVGWLCCCHPVRLSGLPKGLLEIIGGFPWELLDNGWVSVEPHYKTVKRHKLYCSVMWTWKGARLSSYFHNNLNYFNVF